MSNRPIDRRRFFREGLRELLKPLAEAAQPIERALAEFESLTGSSGGSRATAPRHWIRPPGAKDEQAFRDTCSKCGMCVSVCPAHAIKIDSTGRKGGGFPYIEPSAMACVLCDGLHCMQNCPSGALSFVPMTEIDIGTALWETDYCVRRLGEDCTTCIEVCPIGSAAIVLESGNVKVIDAGCTGCGVCEQQCPATPKAIRVVAKSGRDPLVR
jgi:MauM/NapG family ferredoxin protein